MGLKELWNKLFGEKPAEETPAEEMPAEATSSSPEVPTEAAPERPEVPEVPSMPEQEPTTEEPQAAAEEDKQEPSV